MIFLRPPIELPHAPVRIAWLTGLSDPGRCDLSGVQESFLRRIEAPEELKIYRNFPYLPCEQAASPPGLLRASWRNSAQFLAASGWRSKAATDYRRSIVAHWKALADSTDRMLLIAGSCGLEIARFCLAETVDRRCDVRIAALGPVAFSRPRCDCLLVQGSRDGVSRLFFRRPDRRISAVGHMGYASDSRVFDVVNRWVCDNISN